MTHEEQVPVGAGSFPRPLHVAAVVRLVIALVVTFAILPYAWGRVAIMWMLLGLPEALVVAMFVLGVAAVMVLTRKLSAQLDRPQVDRRLAWGIGAMWVGVNVVLLAISSGPLVPWYLIVWAFVPATLWVVWAAWMLYWPLWWRTRIQLLALLVVVAGVGLSIKAEGLTGDARVNFGWRWGKRQQQLLEAGAGIADLSHTTQHDFAQYLGPKRQGVLPQARLARAWEQHPPRLVWRRPVGLGWSSFAVVGEYAVTQEQRGEQECTICYRVADGSIVWSHADRVRFDRSLGGPGPRATPTIAGGRVYALGGTGVLNCLDGVTGQVVWTVNILADNGGRLIAHGVCSSPLVTGDLVIVCPTGGDVSLVAYECSSGKRIWQAGDQRASYGSPMIAELGGERQLLIHAAEGIAGHEVHTGKQVWFFPWTNNERINCAQPIPIAGSASHVFAGTGYGKGCTLFQVERASDESWSCKRLWQSRFMKLKYTTAVLHRGNLYGLDDGILECLDIRTGNKLWKDGRYEHGQILLAGDLLLVQAENGDVALVEPSPDGLRELGRIAALDGKTWNNLALAGKHLLVRNDHEAACYELALEAP